MKKKIIAVVVAALALVAIAFSFVGCGETGGDDIEIPEGMQQYVFEAEYTPVANLVGGAQSGSASGYDLIMQSSAEGVSNGYFVRNIHKTDCALTFEFTAERAGTGAIYLRLLSQWGDTIFTPDNFGVVLNGGEIRYSSMQVKGSSDDAPEFVDKLVTQTAQIRQGDNKLELIVRENTLNDYTHSTGGPAVDCVKIVTDAGLDREPLTENLDHVGQVRG